MVRRPLRLASATVAVLALVGAVASARRALKRYEPDPISRFATVHATVLCTRVTDNGNRVDIEGGTVWTPREAYYIQGSTIPVVYDSLGNVHWDNPAASDSLRTAGYLALCFLCLGLFAGAVMIAGG
jgi:hypothetical protein